MSDYEFYMARLRGDDVPMPDAPQSGRYRLPARRTEGRDGKAPTSWPVAIWRDDGTKKLKVMIGRGRLLEEDSKDTGDAFLEFSSTGWPRCIVVSEQEYRRVIDGGSWADEHDAVSRSNRAPADDSLDAIKERIEDLAREAAKLIEAGAATSQETCDRAADLANEIAKYEKRADLARKAEKQPFVDGAAAVDQRWQPVIAAAAVYRRIKLVVITPWLAALDKKRTEDEFQALARGEKEPHPAERAKVTAGTRGRSVAMRTVKRVEITDRAALLAHFNDHQKLTELLQTLAETSVRAGVTPPGVKVAETKVAA